MNGLQRQALLYQTTRHSTRFVMAVLLISCFWLWHQRNVARSELHEVQTALDSVETKADVPLLLLGDTARWPRFESLLASDIIDTPMVGLRALTWLTRRRSPYIGDNIQTVMGNVHGVGRYGAKRGRRREHKGIDLPGALGTPVAAIRPGVVKFAGSFKDSVNFPGRVVDYGQTVMIEDPIGVEWWYSHLERPLVDRDSVVVAGETVIGRVGMTGNVSQVAGDPVYDYPHCHVTVYDPSITMIVNPTPYLT
jgi:hypothetical protein